MKKLLFFALALLIGTSVYAQEKDITKFLGIPIDGTKSEMIAKLKEKGFTPFWYNNDVLEGEFNGTDVGIFIATNNNKVYRIMVCDRYPSEERDIRIRFNNLCHQFENNPRYIKLSDEEYNIKEDEDIKYNIAVKPERYQASYYQMFVDTLSIVNKARNILLQKYTEEQLHNPTDEVNRGVNLVYYKAMLDVVSKKRVWFMISEVRGEYYIKMYYDNLLNEANGEDL